MLGYDLRGHIDYQFAQFTRNLADIDINIESQRTAARDAAATATELVRSYNKSYSDVHSQNPTQYQEGDYVLVRDTRATVGESAKLKLKYKGPYMIKKTLRNNRYVVTDIPGFNLTSRFLNTILSTDKSKPWVKIST